ncbi:MAG TPA: hypothetical protein VHV77_05745 [Pirellulales bacterium]|nr:hypothetical protein [Pirellulales bacterium]
MPDTPRILFCYCAYAKVVPDKTKEEVLRQLSASGATFDAVADLCEMSAAKDPALAELAQQGPLRIAACYPRAVKWLFHAAGSPLPAEGLTIANMRTETPDEVLKQLAVPQASPEALS